MSTDTVPQVADEPEPAETIQVPLPRFTESSCDDCEWTGTTATAALDHSVTVGHSTRADVINRTLFSRTSGDPS